MKAKVRTFNGTTSPEVTQRETDHRKLAREAAAEGFVLLENKDHFLPLAKGSKVGLYGAGAIRTIKGGTGSGDVNERDTRYELGESALPGTVKPRNSRGFPGALEGVFLPSL